MTAAYIQYSPIIFIEEPAFQMASHLLQYHSMRENIGHALPSWYLIWLILVGVCCIACKVFSIYLFHGLLEILIEYDAAFDETINQLFIGGALDALTERHSCKESRWYSLINRNPLPHQSR